MLTYLRNIDIIDKLPADLEVTCQASTACIPIDPDEGKICYQL